MYVHVGVCGCMWVPLVALNQAPCPQSGQHVVFSFWFVVWVRVGTLHKTANYGRIYKFKESVEAS